MIKIIAEIGWNHLGDQDLAKKMIVEAKNSGANIVKFQLWDPSIMKKGQWDIDGRLEIYKKAKLSDEDVIDLQNFSIKNDIKILFSAFGTIGARRLLSLNFDSIKIPSHEIANQKLISFCSKSFKYIYLSTGASTTHEVENAVNIFKNEKSLKYFNLMHCVSSYPCNINDINLPRLNFLKSFHNQIGLSDHTSDIHVPGFSIGYGTSVIEKHFTIDNDLEGRDNKFALNPSNFKKMVQILLLSKEANKDHGNDFQSNEIDIMENYRGRWEPKDYE